MYILAFVIINLSYLSTFKVAQNHINDYKINVGERTSLKTI